MRNMKKAIKWTLVLMAGLIIWPAAASAQEETDEQINDRVDPNGIFDFVDSHKYSNNMSLTAVVENKKGQIVTEALVAVYASDGIRGKDVVDPTQQNMAFITVYGEGSTPIFFKVYTGGKIYVVDQGLNFEANAIVGLDAPYVIKLKDPVILGDVNGDGKMDAADAVAIANYIVGTPPATFVKTAADVNNDGKITIADAVAIVNSVL